MADLNGVLQDVLSVGGAVLQATQQLDQLVVDAMLIRLENSGFTGLANLVFDFLLRLLDHLFDAGRVDAAVVNQAFDCQAGDFTANRVKSGHNDGFGRIVDDDVHARRRFQRADVAALAADDAALHIVVRQSNDGHGAFRHMVGGTLLNCQRDDVARLFLRFFLGARFNVAHRRRRVVEGFLLHTVDDDLLRFVLRHGGDALQLCVLLGDKGFRLIVQAGGVLLLAFHQVAALLQVVLAVIKAVRTLVQRRFALHQTIFAPLHLGAAFTNLVHLAVVIRLFAVNLILSLENFRLGFLHLFLFVVVCFALVVIRLADGILVQALGSFLAAVDLFFDHLLPVGVACEAAAGTDEQDNQNPYDGWH